MLFRRTSRMAISPTATRAMIRAYSTKPWPDSSLEKACHSAFIHFLPGRTASYGFSAHRGGGAFQAGPARTHRGGMGWPIQCDFDECFRGTERVRAQVTCPGCADQTRFLK